MIFPYNGAMSAGDCRSRQAERKQRAPQAGQPTAGPRTGHRWTNTGILECVSTFIVSLVRMLLLDVNHLACDASCLRCLGDRGENFPGTLLHACFVSRWRVLEHLCVDREHMKRRQDRKRGDFGADFLCQGDAVLDSLLGKFRPVGWYPR